MTEDTTVPFDLLKEALKNKIGFNDDNAFDIAYRVLDYFGYGDEMIDNYLNQEDRRLFYFLQDMQLLTTHWDESILVNGRSWRIFYWNLNRDKIIQAATPMIEVEPKVPGVYDTLPESLWTREIVAD